MIRFFCSLSKCAIAIALISTLIACSSTPDKPKASELPALSSATANQPISPIWSTRVGPVSTPLSVAVHAGQVALASSDGVLVLINASTGRDVWRVALNTPLQAGVGTDGTRFAVVTESNEVITVEAGQIIWRFKLNASTYTSPLVAGGRVFVMTADRTVLALDGATGQRLWSQQRSGDPLVLRQPGLLMAVEDTLVAGLSGRLVGLNPNNGSVRWESVVGASRGTNEVERLVDIVSGVSRQGTVVCARSFQTSVSCVDAAKGGTLWSRPTNGHQGLSGNEEFVVGVDSDSQIMVWNRTNGQPVWNSDVLRFRGLTAPLVVAKSIVFGDQTGLLHRLSLEDGKVQNRTSTDGSAIANQPVSVAGVMVAVTRNGGVYGYRLD
jgi:outer membrane assembly lipoprotein YfgL